MRANLALSTTAAGKQGSFMLENMIGRRKIVLENEINFLTVELTPRNVHFFLMLGYANC